MIRSGPFRTESEFILASASPRRRVLLQDLGLDFEIIESRIEERPAAAESPDNFVLRTAAEKAAAVSAQYPFAWVLGADTIVVLENRILGKPGKQGDAVKMLLALSGRQHQVHTGFCLQNGRKNVTVSRLVTTEVYFSDFSREVAAAYAATGEPLDKAGAYGIQGCGGFLVEKINGSYSNVVGLPLFEVLGELLTYKVVAPDYRQSRTP